MSAQPDPVPSRHPGFSASKERERTLGGVLGWTHVLAALQGDEARSLAMSLYRSAGFGPDDFAPHRAARQAMADALVRTEDHLEIQGARHDAERGRIRAVRRRLEGELWP